MVLYIWPFVISVYILYNIEARVLLFRWFPRFEHLAPIDGLQMKLAGFVVAKLLLQSHELLVGGLHVEVLVVQQIGVELFSRLGDQPVVVVLVGAPLGSRPSVLPLERHAYCTVLVN